MANHKWIESLSVFGIHKVRVYNDNFSKTDEVLKKILSLGNISTIPFEECLATYLGFGFNPSGLFFRNLKEKEFHCKEFVDRGLIYYVSEKFEKNIQGFKYGEPIVLLEGILDVEACAYFTKHSFVIGYSTSYVRSTLAAFLSTLTNKFLIIADNDGNKRIEKNTAQSVKNFQRFGVSPETMTTESSDFGDVLYTKNKTDINKAKYFINKLKGE